MRRPSAERTRHRLAWRNAGTGGILASSIADPEARTAEKTRSLNCPTCGAPCADVNATRCEYCGSRLTYAACPKCFGPMFAGMDYCPSCGANFTRETIGASGVTCPSCKVPMTGMQVGQTALVECPNCYGTWLDAKTFTDLCSSKEERGTFAADFGRHAAIPRTLTPTKVVYLPCPVCGKIMNRQNFGRASGVVIDVCKGDGVWLQQGELHAVLAFIDSGGLEAAREAERAREKAEAQLRELERGAPPNVSIRHDVHVSIIATQGADDGNSLLDRALRSLFSA